MSEVDEPSLPQLAPGETLNVAIFKYLHAFSVFTIHPVKRVLKSPHVHNVDLFFNSRRKLNTPKPIDRFVYRMLNRRPFVEFDTMRDEQVLEQLAQNRYDIVFPDTSFGAVFLGKKMRDLVRFGFLHFHQGLLPKYRGMNTTEWALLLDDYPQITLTFYDRGVDLGDIILTAPIHGRASSIAAVRKINHEVGWKLVDEMFRDPAAVLANRTTQRIGEGLIWFEMCARFKEVVERKVQKHPVFERRPSIDTPPRGNPDDESDTSQPVDPVGAKIPALIRELKMSPTFGEMSQAEQLISLAHFVAKRARFDLLQEVLPLLRAFVAQDIRKIDHLRLLNEFEGIERASSESSSLLRELYPGWRERTEQLLQACGDRVDSAWNV